MAEDNVTTDAERGQIERARHAEYMRAHRAANREKYKEIDRQHHERQKAKDPERFRLMRLENDRRCRERKRQQPKTSEEVEELRRRSRERNRKYREKHRERVREMARENARRRYAEDPTKQLANVKRYQATPKGYASVIANARRRLARLREAGGEVTAAQWEEILKRHNYCCKYCGKPLTAKGDRTMDHVIPLTKGGTHTPDNVVPSCRRCNSCKYNKIITVP